MRITFFSIFLSALVVLTIFSTPARGLYSEDDVFDAIQCTDDGNNYHINATNLEFHWFEHNAVCEADMFDWFCFHGPGEVDWQAGISLATNGPGLAVRVYFDDGNNLTQVYEDSPSYNSNSGTYILSLQIHDLCLDAGIPPPLVGDFYIRITYYSAYPGMHPYHFTFHTYSQASLPGGANTSTTGNPLPLDEVHYGTLTQTDFYDWYYWEHPSGATANGFIEILRMGGFGSVDAPTMRVNVFYANGVYIGSADTSDEWPYADVDLQQFNLGPGRYNIQVQLTASVNNPVTYMVRNKSIIPNQNGYLGDSNTDEVSAVSLSADTRVGETICRPRDPADFYSYESDTYFIGDILILPWNQSGLFSMTVKANGKKYQSDPIPFTGVSYFRSPVPPGTLSIEMRDIVPACRITPYEIEVAPDGAGPYHAPGHGSWDTAQDIMKTHYYSFELEPGQQDRYCFSASTPGLDVYLVGFMEIYGSRADYEVRVGLLSESGPAWGQVMAPDSDGRIVLDFGYEILVDPGSYILRIKLGDSATGRRRFYVNQTLSLAACYPEAGDTFYNPRAAYLSRNGSNWTLSDVLCPPDDTIDFCSVPVNSDTNLEAVPPGYNMTVRAGYAGMRFKLYNFSEVIVWQTQISELGGSESVNLSSIVQDGEDYVLEVSTDAAEERLMLWEVEFKPSLFLLIDPEFMKIRMFWKRPVFPGLEHAEYL